ncbi:DUF3238 domain-containing protein [Paenibacillus sp. FSL M8-0212]|uniref:DUF3238 domain-containing protein n=1 Tax=unclassified Paenibacillus TaxID=185978 RepID=UPI0030F7AB4E
MNKVRTIILCLIIILSISNPINASAESKASNSDDNLKIETASNSIHLTLNDTQGLITVEDLDQNNKIIYQGDNNEVVIDDLDSSTLYRFKVSYLSEEGNKEMYISTETDTNSYKALTNSDEFKIKSNAVVYPEKVVLSWEDVPGVNKYSILKNGVMISETQTNKFVDHFDNNEVYNTYEIQFDIPLTPSEKEEIREFYAGKNFNLGTEELENLSKKPYSIIKVIDASIVNPSLSLAAVNNSFKWTYKTFIPMEYAEDPWYNAATWGQNIKFFKGDNRGFSSSAETYRTKTVGDSIFYTDSTTASEAFYKDVSTTHALDKDKKLVSTKTDSGQYINRIINSNTSSKTDVTVYHKSGNPYAVAGNEIDYQMRVITQKGGAYSFVGTHDRAPAHELYVRLSNGTTLTIFNHPHEGFEYLGAPSTLARNFNISN